MRNQATPQNTHDHTHRVVYRDTDQMGIVYYANFFVFMEIGRVELLRARGWTYRAMEEAGVRIPVLHASCDYRRSALYDDLLRIRTTLTLLNRVRLEFGYEIHCDARGELLATGVSKHAFTDTQNRLARVDQSVIHRILGTPPI